MRRHLSCLLLAALAAGSVHAAGPNAPEAECAALGKLAYPAVDRPSAAQQAALASCDAPALYYGIRQPRDFVKARHCAFTPDKDDDVFSKKAGVLMMLYANGQGVARNLQLAKKAACAAGGAPAELSGRLTHLNDMAPGKSAAGQTIDFCEDVTSGMMMGYCASLGAAQDDVKREGALAAIAATFKPNERAAFSHLLNSLSRFVEARGGNEVDLSGTARGAMVVEEEDAQKDAFLAALQAFERTHVNAVQRKAHGNALYIRRLSIGMQTTGGDPFHKPVIVIHIKNQQSVTAITEVIPDPGRGYVQVSPRPRGFTRLTRLLRYTCVYEGDLEKNQPETDPLHTKLKVYETEGSL